MCVKLWFPHRGQETHTGTKRSITKNNHQQWREDSSLPGTSRPIVFVCESETKVEEKGDFPFPSKPLSLHLNFTRKQK
eukprot:gene9377-6596_t